jgi:molybdate/tungstate transport system substrate-binding protein
VYPEETLVGGLQAGQLDAGSFYTSDLALKATCTETVLDQAPHQAAAEAFAAYLPGLRARK